MTGTMRLCGAFTPYLMALLGTPDRSINWTFYANRLRGWVKGKRDGVRTWLTGLLRGWADAVDTGHEDVELVAVMTATLVPEPVVELPEPVPQSAPVVYRFDGPQGPCEGRLEDMTKADLLLLAAQRGVPLRKTWTKGKMLDALRERLAA